MYKLSAGRLPVIFTTVFYVVMAVIVTAAYGKNDAVVDGTPPKTALELYDEESRDVFKQKRLIVEQKERLLAATVNTVTDNIIYDMHREIAAEMMLRYDTQGKISEVQEKKDQIRANIRIENEEYAEVLVKLRSIEEELLARGIELKSVVLQNVDNEIGNVKRKLSREALKKILEYEKQKRGTIIKEILHDKREVVIEDEKDRAKREMLLEIVKLGGASPGLEKLIMDRTRSIDQVKGEVVSVLGTDEYNRKVMQLQEEAKVKRHQIAEQFSMEQEAYEKLRRKVAELKVVVDRSRLIKSATADQRLRMARREYRNALLHYTNGAYRVAALKIEAILKDYPAFDDKATALFVLAESKLALNQYDEAEGRYIELLLDYAGSEYAGIALYRITDIAYLFGDYVKITDYAAQFPDITGDPGIVTSINYMVGRSLYFQELYAEAGEKFAAITEGADYVPAALYMRGLCYIRTNMLDSAVVQMAACMEKALPNISLDVSIRQLYDDANISQGHLLFTLRRYEDALMAYGRVDKQSLRYEEVLIGKLWVAFAIEAYDRTVSYAALLADRYPASDFYYEATVLKGIALSKLRLYDEAAEAYENIIEIQDGIDLLDEYALTRVALTSLASRIAAAANTAIAYNDTARFIKVRRISRGVAESRGVLNSCEDYVKTLFTVEDMSAKVASLRGALSAIGSGVAKASTDIALMSRDVREIHDLAKNERNEKAMTESDLEYKKMRIMLGQLRGMEADLQQFEVETRNSSLQKAVERSECGKLDIEFAQQQESQVRIHDIKAINQSIDAILNDVETPQSR